MSRDSDPHQRKWLSLGYGGKTAPKTTWRYWEKPGARTGTPSTWIISAPNGLAEFEQRGKSVFYQGAEILAEPTQWLATWSALGYFYAKILPELPAPPLSTE
jgi:hypothetical protein